MGTLVVDEETDEHPANHRKPIVMRTMPLHEITLPFSSLHQGQYLRKSMIREEQELASSLRRGDNDKTFHKGQMMWKRSLLLLLLLFDICAKASPDKSSFLRRQISYLRC
jgi:hypothetical protein